MPEGWLSVCVQDLFGMVGGGTPSTTVSEYWTGCVPWITSADIDGEHCVVPRRFITEQAIRDSATNKVPAGSAIVVTRVGLGKVALAPTDLCFSQDSQALLFNPSLLNAHYVLHYMGEAVGVFRHISRGTTISGVTKKQLASLAFFLPPFAEQGRIVAEIEKQFTRLDAAVAALKRVRANLKRYWASVLKAACEGCLVPTEAELARKGGRSYESGDELLARILKERRAKWEADYFARTLSAGTPPKDDTWKRKYKVPLPPDISNLPPLAEGWTWASVAQVGEVQLGRQRAPQHHNGPYMRPYLRVANVLEYQIDVSHVLEMNFTPKEFETYSLRFGDILLNEGQSLELVGRAAMYRDEIPGACFQKTLLRFRPATGVNGKFALFVFLAYLHMKFFQKISRWTTSMAHLTAERFLLMHFPLPPLAEQDRIVTEVERLTSVSASVQRSLADHLSRVGRLRQSILKRAFEGKLVSQDPGDEPASVLLERIRVERSMSKPVKKMPRTKRSQGVMEVV